MWLEILEQRMERPLIQLVDELGGWPILRPDWDPDKFDWLLLTAKLRLYNNDVLISEWVGPDIKNSDKYVIQVTHLILSCFAISIKRFLYSLIKHRSDFLRETISFNHLTQFI